MKLSKIYLCFTPFICLIGIIFFQYSYNAYLDLAATKMNYNYLFMCILKLIPSIWFLIAVIYYLKNIEKIKSILIIEIIQIILLISIIIISAYNEILYSLIFNSIEYLFLWCMIISIQIYKQSIKKGCNK